MTTEEVFPLLTTRQDRLNHIFALELAMLNAGLPSIDLPTRHHITPDTYTRELDIPADTLIVGHMHRHGHVNLLVKGTVTVACAEGTQTISAPFIYTSPPGTKRAIYAHTDATWVCSHHKPRELSAVPDLEQYLLLPEPEAMAFWLSLNPPESE